MTTALRQFWPLLFLLPGLLALFVAFLAPTGQDTLWAWCATYWWQLIFSGALAYFAVIFAKRAFSWMGRRAHRPDA